MDTEDSFSKSETRHLADSVDTGLISAQPTASAQRPLVGAYVALLLFMSVYYGRPEEWIPGLSHVPLAKVTVILALIPVMFSLRHIRQHLPGEILFLVLLIGQLFLASFLSPVWRGGAVRTTVSFAKVLVVVFVMAMTVSTLRRLRLLIFVQATSVATMAAVILWKGHSILGRLEGMPGGSYSDPNDLALAFVISLPLCLAFLFLTRNRIEGVAWIFAILIMTFAIILTGSRGGFLSLIVTGVVCLWEFAIRGRRPYFLVLTVLLAVIVLVSSSEILTGRLKSTFSIGKDAGAYDSVQSRQKLFWRGIEVTKEYPFFGVGPGNFAQLSGSWHVTHNSFTQMSSEGGIPALTFYLLILWSGFKNIRATRRFANRPRETILLCKGLHASLAGYVIGSCFLSVNLAFFPYFLVVYTSALFSITKRYQAQSKGTKPVSQEKAGEETSTPIQGAIDPALWAH